MLVNWTQPKHVFIFCGKTHLRKGIDGLAAVVAKNYDLDLFDDSLFLFCGTRNDRFKGRYWDGEGFILLYKRFENGGLRWPRRKPFWIAWSIGHISLKLQASHID